MPVLRTFPPTPHQVYHVIRFPGGDEAMVPAAGPNRHAALVLAAVLLDPDRYLDAALPAWGLDPDIARPLRLVWRAALELHYQERPVDVVSIRGELGWERLHEVGGLRALSGLALLVAELPSPLAAAEVRGWAAAALGQEAPTC